MLKKLLISLIFLSFTSSHPMYISVTEINYNTRTHSVEVIHKIFIDDFEEAMEQKHGKKLGLGTAKLLENKDELINQYVNEYFTFYLNEEETAPTFVGSEDDLEAIWIYQEIDSVEQIESIEILSSFLFDLLDDQKNIVHFKYLEQKKSFLFKKGDKMEKAVLSN